jgi:hypothetical protein
MKTTAELILEGMAKAYFATAWADVQDEKGAGDVSRVNLSGKEIMSLMPDVIDPAAWRAAFTLDKALCQCNGVEGLTALYERAEMMPVGKYADRLLEPDLFGHYLAMQAMGSGVGLESFGLDTVDGGIVRDGEVLPVKGREVIAVPYLESVQLDKDY